MAVRDTRGAEANTDPRYRVMQIGVVVDNDDPIDKGRVRVRVPGLKDPASEWAWPLSLGGGSKNRGYVAVPEVGAEVAVWFAGGRGDRLYYMSAQWGAPEGESELPVEAQGAGPDVVVISTPGMRVVLDETEGGRRLTIKMVRTGDSIEIDEQTSTLSIQAKGRVAISAVGQVEIDGLNVIIKGRTVRPISDPI